jgi:hypothetical protein
MAIMLADRLTRSDSATIPTISGSKLPIKATAVMRACKKSCIHDYVPLQARMNHGPMSAKDSPGWRQWSNQHRADVRRGVGSGSPD